MTARNEGDDQTSEQGYEVGYGRPPEKSQFKPGQSGNPKGRKRKPKSTQDQMKTILSKRITITEAGHSKRMTLQEVILRSIANKAAKGDLRAANFVLNLINSDEAAQADTIVQANLSAEDQVLFEQMMTELAGDGATLEAESNAPDHPIPTIEETLTDDT